MRQIYQFDRVRPPRLTEAMLRRERERRQLRRQTALLALAGMLVCACLLAVSWLLLVRGHPLLALACVLYLCAALTGGGVLTIVAVQRRKELTSWNGLSS